MNVFLRDRKRRQDLLDMSSIDSNWSARTPAENRQWMNRYHLQ